mmetsp:Transcript_1832/g.5116  ORF Transcript_1832/g.5116 Transcript_1832/m.5116 type:complete len:212 (+) Transcript_1832:1341-1976(+)
MVMGTSNSTFEWRCRPRSRRAQAVPSARAPLSTSCCGALRPPPYRSTSSSSLTARRCHHKARLKDGGRLQWLRCPAVAAGIFPVGFPAQVLAASKDLGWPSLKGALVSEEIWLLPLRTKASSVACSPLGCRLQTDHLGLFPVARASFSKLVEGQHMRPRRQTGFRIGCLSLRGTPASEARDQEGPVPRQQREGTPPRFPWTHPPTPKVATP